MPIASCKRRAPASSSTPDWELSSDAKHRLLQHPTVNAAPAGLPSGTPASQNR